MHASSLLWRALWMPSVLGTTSTPSLHNHDIMPHPPYSCIVRFPIFVAPYRLSIPALTLVPYPSSPLLFLLLGTRPPACLLIERTPSPLLFHPSTQAHVGSAPWLMLSPPHNHQCFPSTPPPLPVCCAPPPFTTIRCPWSLLFFFIPIHSNPKQSCEI